VSRLVVAAVAACVLLLGATAGPPEAGATGLCDVPPPAAASAGGSTPVWTVRPFAIVLPDWLAALWPQFLPYLERRIEQMSWRGFGGFAFLMQAWRPDRNTLCLSPALFWLGP
jgi:hypothetical protein